MKKMGLWVLGAVGLASLCAGCATCPSCENKLAPVGERSLGYPGTTGSLEESGGSYNPVVGTWQRTWPYGANLANPPWQ